MIEYLEGRKFYKVETFVEPGYASVERREVQAKNISEAQVVSSELLNGQHAPAIDIDHRVYVVRSSTPDHCHLYIDVEMSWRKYKRLLRAMVAAGIVERGYYRASVARRGTHLRLPWVKKVQA